jgi:integrase
MALYRRRDIWYIDYYADGKRYREVVGRNRKSAERALAKREVQVAEDRFLDLALKRQVRFDQLILQYLEYAKVNKLSWDRDQRSIKVLNRWFADKLLNQITALAIEKFKNQRRQEVGPATVNRELACLKGMFSKAIQWDMASANPVKMVKLFKENPGRTRYLQNDEIIRLLQEAAKHLRPILIVALYTGMRKGEILKLTWNDIDIDNRLIHVRNSKNGESRKVPMAEEVFKILNQLQKMSDQLFTHSDGSPVVNIRTCFNNAVKRAGIRGFTFHDLRHTFASHLVMNSVDLLTVKELLGHKTIGMTLRYAHLSPLHRQTAVDTLQYLNGHKSVTRLKNIVAQNPVSRYNTRSAGVVELVDTRDLKSLVS